MEISNKAKGIVDSCRFCWMCRHVCPIGNATGLERNTARARALGCSLVNRGAASLEDVSTNLYECMLCGACTNNCKTGWDPKVFIEEFRTQLILEGKAPSYINKIVSKIVKEGNPYGKLSPKLKTIMNKDSKTVFVAGQDALYNLPASIETVAKLFNKINKTILISEETSNTGFSLYFFTGKTEETRQAMQKWAKAVEDKELVIFYDAQDLAFVSHKFAEWNISVKPKLISFNAYLLKLIKDGTIAVNKSSNVYTAQDNYSYSRDMNDNSIYDLIKAVGVNKEILLNRNETNASGHLLMSLYMKDVINMVAANRLLEAKRQEVKTLVTESASEYYFLKKNASGVKVISVEEMILENMR